MSKNVHPPWGGRSKCPGGAGFLQNYLLGTSAPRVVPESGGPQNKIHPQNTPTESHKSRMAHASSLEISHVDASSASASTCTWCLAMPKDSPQGGKNHLLSGGARGKRYPEGKFKYPWGARSIFLRQTILPGRNQKVYSSRVSRRWEGEERRRPSYGIKIDREEMLIVLSFTSGVLSATSFTSRRCFLSLLRRRQFVTRGWEGKRSTWRGQYRLSDPPLWLTCLMRELKDGHCDLETHLRENNANVLDFRGTSV